MAQKIGISTGEGGRGSRRRRLLRGARSSWKVAAEGAGMESLCSKVRRSASLDPTAMGSLDVFESYQTQKRQKGE